MQVIFIQPLLMRRANDFYVYKIIFKIRYILIHLNKIFLMKPVLSAEINEGKKLLKITEISIKDIDPKF